MAGPEDELAGTNLLSSTDQPDDSPSSSQYELEMMHEDRSKNVLPRNTRRRARSFSQTYLNFNRARTCLGAGAIFLAAIALLVALLSIFSPAPAPTSDNTLSKVNPTSPYCTTWSADTATWPHMETDPLPLDPQTQSVKDLPEGVKVVGIIFYGRARYTDVLDCYLQRNLKSNGGLLDEVAFMNHTQNPSDLEFLSDVVAKQPGYRVLAPPADCQGNHYGCIWKRIVNSGLYDDKTLLIKIDDDIIFVHDNTIPQLVRSRLAHPTAFAISANLINSPMTGYLHYHTGAIQPYLPEAVDTPKQPVNKPTWRSSELPDYVGPFSFNFDAESMVPPFKGHRWLPVNRASIPMLTTPMGVADSVDNLIFGTYWRSWAIAAQQHYSLLHNLELNTTERYYLSISGVSNDDASLEGMWDMQYRRYNLNFLAIWAKDVRANLPIDADDEEAFTVTLPRKLGRPLLIDTRAIVAHFSFYTQKEGMTGTDILDRYRAYANEKVCKVGEKRFPLREKLCPGYRQG